MKKMIDEYSQRLGAALALPAMGDVPNLAEAFRTAWALKKTIYICGNGGSAGNANHLAMTSLTVPVSQTALVCGLDP